MLTHTHPQESKQSTIELKDDNPTALEALIRWLYTLPVVVRNHEPCAFWLSVRLTADKYLASDLSQKAFDNFWHAVSDIGAAGEILKIIDTIERDMSHDELVMDAAARLRKRWLRPLLRFPAFRDQLREDTDLMLELLEHASSSITVQQTLDPFSTPQHYNNKKLVRFSHKMKTFLCESHKQAVLYPDNSREGHGRGHCSYCSISHGVVGLPLIDATCVTMTDKDWSPLVELADTTSPQNDGGYW